MSQVNQLDRSHQSSTQAKAVFFLGHLAIVLFCTWLVIQSDNIDGLIRFPDTTRALLLLGCAALYWARHGVTLFYLLQRRLGWAEAMGLLSFFASFEIGLLLIGGGEFAVPLGPVDAIALALLLLGSYLNTSSEVQRKWWKKDPNNKGKCYTLGLFSYSMHINYFGDVVLFTGWCLLTSHYWTLALPALMTYMFVKHHIPGLDAHLAARYGEAFTRYSASTKKLVPFVY